MKISTFKIINSKTKAAILSLFFNNPEQEYYLRQIEKITGYSVGNIRREMLKLEAEGLFSARYIGKLKLYKLNPSYLLYEDIKNIVRKTIGVEGALKAIFSDNNDISFAFIYGSFAEGKEKTLSDIDIIVIGTVKPIKIRSSLFEYQSKIGREINSIVYSEDEFLNKLKNKNHFVSGLIDRRKIFLKGEEDEFRRFTQIRKTRKT